MGRSLSDRLPLLYVFVAGIGFSVQGLVIKLIAEMGVEMSMTVILARGIVQMLLSAAFIYDDEDRKAGKGPSLFGDSHWVTSILIGRSLLGYVGMMGHFRAVEFIPIGDCTVLVMMCPIISALAGFVLLGEPWRLPEFIATLLALTGGVLVAKPSFLFGNDEGMSSAEDAEYFWGVLYSLMSAVTGGLSFVFIRILGTSAKMPWANICFAQSIAQVLFSIPCMHLFGQRMEMPTGPALGLILFAAVIGSISQIIMTVGMQREKSASATAMLTSEVIAGYLLQVAFTLDPVNRTSLLGAALVSVGIVVIVMAKQPEPSLPFSVAAPAMARVVSSNRLKE